MTPHAGVRLPVSLDLTGPGQDSRAGTGQTPLLMGPWFSKSPPGALRVEAGGGRASGTRLKGTLKGVCRNLVTSPPWLVRTQNG